MYYNDVMKYLQQLHQYVQQQDQKIQQLHATVLALKKDIEEIKKQPHTNIDKIEYKFDQLKVEHLAGTLNIGLNPTDPGQIDNFDVQQNGMNVNGIQQQLKNQIYQQCSEEINHFLNDDCQRLIEQMETQYELRLDDPHRRHIIEDIRKQIDSRIHYYLNAQPITEQDSLLDKKQEILQLVKQDVENSINHFLNHLPKNSS